MKEIVSDEKMVSYCGLFCGACGAYLKGKCPGCAENEKAVWCEVRKCCQENQYRTCADCRHFAVATECRKFDNFIGRMIGFVFGTSRLKGIEKIKKEGVRVFADEMAEKKMVSMKKKD